MIPRLLTDQLVRYAGYYPVLVLTGPRQSGKTTLAKDTFPEHAYVSLEDLEFRQFATEDPKGFLARFDGAMIIDEVQRVPDLLSALQTSVDRDPRMGRFVLTGSHNFLLMHQVSQSLAGRCGIFNLFPFSRAELEQQSQEEPRGPESLFRATHTDRSCWELIWSGLYPPIHDRNIPPHVWLSDYVQTYVERDVRQLVNIGDLDTFGRFVMLCAGRAGQLLNYSGLASDCGISVDTAKRWISLLKTSFLIHLLPPYHRNFSKRIIKSPKLYFIDTGLCCYLLGIRSVEQLQTHPLRGHLFENYVVSEIIKAYANHRLSPPLYFWRDQSGHEVDLLFENGTDLYPVEIKSGQTIADDMFDGLRWWSRLAGVPLEAATLIYGGGENYVRRGVSVRPWYAI